MSKQDTLMQLETKIAETRAMLDELEATAKQLREKRQHEAIDQLDELFPNSEWSLEKFGPFKEEITLEWRELIDKLKKYI